MGRDDGQPLILHQRSEEAEVDWEGGGTAQKHTLQDDVTGDRPTFWKRIFSSSFGGQSHASPDHAGPSSMVKGRCQRLVLSPVVRR